MNYFLIFSALELLLQKLRETCDFSFNFITPFKLMKEFLKYKKNSYKTAVKNLKQIIARLIFLYHVFNRLFISNNRLTFKILT